MNEWVGCAWQIDNKEKGQQRAAWFQEKGSRTLCLGPGGEICTKLTGWLPRARIGPEVLPVAVNWQVKRGEDKWRQRAKEWERLES